MSVAQTLTARSQYYEEEEEEISTSTIYMCLIDEFRFGDLKFYLMSLQTCFDESMDLKPVIKDADETCADQKKPLKRRRKRGRRSAHKDKNPNVTNTAATDKNTLSPMVMHTQPPKATFSQLGHYGTDPHPRAATERSRLDGIQSWKDNSNVQRFGGPTQYSEYINALNADLITVITESGKDCLTQAQADEVLAKIESIMFEESAYFDPNISVSGPVFRGRPVFKNWTLQLWCENKFSVEWLQRTVAAISLESGASLRICKPSDLTDRVRCSLLVPKEQDSKDIGRMLRFQNPWAEIERWRVLSFTVSDNRTFVIVTIPNDLIGKIMEHERRLAFYLGSVYVKFAGPGGKFVENPPDQKTEENSYSAGVEENPPSLMNSVLYSDFNQDAPCDTLDDIYGSWDNEMCDS